MAGGRPGRTNEVYRVDGTEDRRFAVTMPAELAGAASLRRLVTTHLHHWRLLELAERATLVAHELYANAVVHGSRPGDEVRVEVERRDDEVRIAVADASSALPATERPGEEAERGRGLSIVEWLAGSWSARADGQGKVVWATLPVPLRVESEAVPA